MFKQTPFLTPRMTCKWQKRHS